MPIVSTSPIEIPAGSDNLKVSMNLATSFTDTGVRSTGQISFQHYRQAAAGQKPVPIGAVNNLNFPDVDAAAQADADLAAMYQAIYTAVATYAAAKGI